ncbi:MAG: dihydrofolate reductase [Candidatus Magasanikbacteria bacterium]
MLSLIAAVSSNNCIGKNNALPWDIPEDLKHFKDITDGHAVLMGQNTWESIPEKFRPLPNRKNIVLTKEKDYKVPGNVDVYNSIDEALEKYKNKDLFVIGGASIYAQTINKVDQLFITEVHQFVDGDTFFPEIDKNVWKEVSREKHEGFDFVNYSKQ